MTPRGPRRDIRARNLCPSVGRHWLILIPSPQCFYFLSSSLILFSFPPPLLGVCPRPCAQALKRIRLDCVTYVTSVLVTMNLIECSRDLRESRELWESFRTCAHGDISPPLSNIYTKKKSLRHVRKKKSFVPESTYYLRSLF
jgi:hypothetical protein